MNEAHKSNLKIKRIKRIKNRLKETVGADRKAQLEARLAQIS